MRERMTMSGSTVRRRAESGYSLAELLTVVSIIGIVTLVSVPAIFQLMPQYRIRAAASELATAVRMTRQKAIAMRTPWKLVFDTDGERYAAWILSGDDQTDPDDWTPVSVDWKVLEAGDDPQWHRIAAADLRLGTKPFHDVDDDDMTEIIFLRDGRLSDLADASSSELLDDDPPPSVVLAVENRWVRFNRYQIQSRMTGAVEIVPSKVVE